MCIYVCVCARVYYIYLKVEPNKRNTEQGILEFDDVTFPALTGLSQSLPA